MTEASRASRAPFLVGTSWKMTHRLSDATRDVETLSSTASWTPAETALFVLPPFTLIPVVASGLRGTGVRVGAQDVHWEDHGAFTGEVSGPMLVDAGATIAEIGHSERRELFGDTDERVGAKVVAALRNGLTPLVCVGELGRVRTEGDTVAHLESQVSAALASAPQAAEVWIAYEPVWAIGERGSAAEPALVSDTISDLRRIVDELRGSGSETRLLYGGSVDETNAAGYAAIPLLDGLFVGRAAWSAEGLVRIAGLCAAARKPANQSPLSGRSIGPVKG